MASKETRFIRETRLYSEDRCSHIPRTMLDVVDHLWGAIEENKGTNTGINTIPQLLLLLVLVVQAVKSPPSPYLAVEHQS